eukprot:266041_1
MWSLQKCLSEIQNMSSRPAVVVEPASNIILITYIYTEHSTQAKELGVAVCGIIFGAIYESVSGAIYEIIFGKVYATVFGVVYNKNEKNWKIKNMKFIIRETRNMVMEEKNYLFVSDIFKRDGHGDGAIKYSSYMLEQKLFKTSCGLQLQGTFNSV